MDTKRAGTGALADAGSERVGVEVGAGAKAAAEVAGDGTGVGVEAEDAGAIEAVAEAGAEAEAAGAVAGAGAGSGSANRCRDGGRARRPVEPESWWAVVDSIAQQMVWVEQRSWRGHAGLLLWLWG